MSGTSPAAPGTPEPQPTAPQPPTERPAQAAHDPSQLLLPGVFNRATTASGWAEAAWKAAFPLIPEPVRTLVHKRLVDSNQIDRVPPWLGEAWMQRSSRLDIQPSLGPLTPLFPPLPLSEWRDQYRAHLCMTEWQSAPADPRQDWRALAVLSPNQNHPIPPAKPQHPPLLIPPGPQVWLVWTAPVRTAQPEPVLLLCSTPNAPRRGEILRAWHKETAWERTLTISEDALHLEDPEDQDMLGLVRLLSHQGRVFQECPPEDQEEA